jgi:hypothetical protein
MTKRTQAYQEKPELEDYSSDGDEEQIKKKKKPRGRKPKGAKT